MERGLRAGALTTHPRPMRSPMRSPRPTRRRTRGRASRARATNRSSALRATTFRVVDVALHSGSSRPFSSLARRLESRSHAGRRCSPSRRRLRRHLARRSRARAFRASRSRLQPRRPAIAQSWSLRAARRRRPPHRRSRRHARRLRTRPRPPRRAPSLARRHEKCLIAPRPILTRARSDGSAKPSWRRWSPASPAYATSQEMNPVHAGGASSRDRSSALQDLSKK